MGLGVAKGHVKERWRVCQYHYLVMEKITVNKIVGIKKIVAKEVAKRLLRLGKCFYKTTNLSLHDINHLMRTRLAQAHQRNSKKGLLG